MAFKLVADFLNTSYNLSLELLEIVIDRNNINLYEEFIQNYNLLVKKITSSQSSKEV